MEGSLPRIGLTLETPAALTKSADPAAAPGRFAALIDDSAGKPAGGPAGNALPLPGQVLPQSAPLFRSIAGAGQPDLPAALSTTPGDTPIPGLPGTPGTITEETYLSVTMTDVAAAPGAGIANMPGAEEIPGADVLPVADDPSARATGLEPFSGVTPVGTAAAAPAEVIEMVRQLENDSATRSDTGLRSAATALAQGIKPEMAPGLPPVHPDPVRLPEGPAPIVARTVTANPVPIGNPAVSAPMLATMPRVEANRDPAMQAGILTALTGQAVQDPAAAGPDGSDLPDLPFESIRVTVREAGGERPLPNREPAFQLPGPRQPLGDPQWARSLGERLAVVVRGEHQTARMSLNPAHLGPIDIQLRLQDDQAQLWLTAQHPQAREALEAAIPRLREMFAQQGIDLSQHGNSGQPGEPGTHERTGRSAVTASGTGGEESEPESVPARARRETGLIDAYA